jgi:hypothetical protein
MATEPDRHCLILPLTRMTSALDTYMATETADPYELHLVVTRTELKILADACAPSAMWSWLIDSR